MSSEKYTVSAGVDDFGNVFVPIPDEILKSLNLKEGDSVECKVEGGKIIFTKC